MRHVVNGGADHPDILGQDGVLRRDLLVNRLDFAFNPLDPAFNRFNPTVYGGKGLQ